MTRPLHGYSSVFSRGVHTACVQADRSARTGQSHVQHENVKLVRAARHQELEHRTEVTDGSGMQRGSSTGAAEYSYEGPGPGASPITWVTHRKVSKESPNMYEVKVTPNLGLVVTEWLHVQASSRS